MGVPMDAPAFVSAVHELLGQVQESLLASATTFRDENIVDVSSYEELKAAVAAGGVQATGLRPCFLLWDHEVLLCPGPAPLARRGREKSLVDSTEVMPVCAHVFF